MNFLSKQEIFRKAPSVFAENPAAHVSDKYAFVPTTQVLETLGQAGWGVVRAEESRVRIEGKRGYQKHLVRLRHVEAESILKVGDSLPEIVLTNSHDGLASFNLSLGLFRLVCSNGLVIADSLFESARIKHIGYQDDSVLNIVSRIVESAPLVLDTVQQFQGIQLTAGEQVAFAQGALALRWEEENTPIDARDLLRPRRSQDQGNTVWNTYNVIQENMLKGGIRGRTSTNRRTRTRGVTSVSQDVKLNKALWTMAQALANHKRGV